MNMVNPDTPSSLDTPEDVKRALLGGADLYNPETGEFWWMYNGLDSIAQTTVPIDDPNLIAALGKEDFDLYEDIVGGFNYTGRITDSPEYYAENPTEPDPGYDERQEVFDRIASEDGWIVATPESVRAAVSAAPAAWKAKYIPVEIKGDDAVVMHPMANGMCEYIAARGYDEETGHWSSGSYFSSLAEAAAAVEGREIVPEGTLCSMSWDREEIELRLEQSGYASEGKDVDAVISRLGLDETDLALSRFASRIDDEAYSLIGDAIYELEYEGQLREAEEAKHWETVQEPIVPDGCDLDEAERDHRG